MRLLTNYWTLRGTSFLDKTDEQLGMMGMNHFLTFNRLLLVRGLHRTQTYAQLSPKSEGTRGQC